MTLCYEGRICTTETKALFNVKELCAYLGIGQTKAKSCKWIYRQYWQKIICPQGQAGQVADETDIVASLTIVARTVCPVLFEKQ